MSYTYLFELYKMIDHRIDSVDQSSSKLSPNSDLFCFHQGQKDVLIELRSFLEKQLNPKLPRAIAKKLKKKST